MIWLKTVSIPRRYGYGLVSIGLAGLALLAALVVLAAFEPPSGAFATPSIAPILTSVLTANFSLDDFDDRQRPPGFARDIPRLPNDYFANQGIYIAGGMGALITDTINCTATHSCYLSLAYDLSAQVNSEGGYVEELGYSYT